MNRVPGEESGIANFTYFWGIRTLQQGDIPVQIPCAGGITPVFPPVSQDYQALRFSSRQGGPARPRERGC